jgi:hypothetical protein
LSVDGISGPAVLLSQPVISQVQVDPSSFDRGVPGLSLQGFK